MFPKQLNASLARSIVALLCAGFIQIGISAPAAHAAAPIKPTISSVTSDAGTIAVNMVTTGIDATQWRWTLTRRQTFGCDNSYMDGVVQPESSLLSVITINGTTAGCRYVIKVAGYNGVIGEYAEHEILAGGATNGLNIFAKTESGLSANMTRTPLDKDSAGVCNWALGGVSNIDVDYGSTGPSLCPTDGFTSYYIGYVKAPYTGTVNFKASVDDGFILNIQGQNVITYLLEGAATTYNTSGSINMVANEVYRIEAWHHEYNGGSVAKLFWDWSGQATVIVPSANLATDPSVFGGGCPLGLTAQCSAGSALEIKKATGTNMDGQYWIDVNGTPTLTYCIMNSVMSGGGWMLAMKGKKTTSTFNYLSSYWTNSTQLNNAYPERWKLNDTARDVDAKYGVFSYNKTNQILALFPEQTSYAGGAISAGTNGNISGIAYGFSWLETTTAGRLWTSADGASYSRLGGTGYPQGSSCVTSATTLTNLFSSSSRCAFRKVSSTYSASESPYSAVGNGLFYTQADIRFFGINYANSVDGAPVRFGFGWNENGATNEDSNDGSGGIGLTYSSYAVQAGTVNGCCATVNGLSGVAGTGTNIPFEMYIRNSISTDIYGHNLRVTSKRTNSMTAGNAFSTSNTNGSNTFRLTPGRVGLSINSSTGAISVAENLPIGDYTTTVTVTDTNGVSGTKTVTVQVLAESGETDTALSFDGNQSIATGGTFGLWGSQTYEAWIKPTNSCSQSTGNNTAISTGNFLLICKNSYWYISYLDSSDVWSEKQTSLRVVGGEWVHIAIVRSGTTVTAYGNNSQLNFWQSNAWVSSVTQSTIKNGYYALRVGGTGTANQYFNGLVDELKVWDSARTLTQIWNGAQSLENVSQANLMMYWDFNEGSGSAISRAQRVDNNFNLTPASGAQWVPIIQTVNSGPYTVVTVPRTLISINPGWRAPTSISAISVLMAGGGAGGGGGGYNGATGAGGGGGGGAGSISERKISVSPNTLYPIVIGAFGVGGVGATSASWNGINGARGETTSAFSLTAKGGSPGWGAAINSGGGWTDGSGGIGGSSGNDYLGGSKSLTAGAGGAGGAGATANGQNAGGTTAGAAGGAGLVSSITYSTSTYATGGAGGIGTTSSGVMGTEGAAAATLTASGGAGGGGAISAITGYGGAGSSGFVILRYITVLKPTFTAPTRAYLNVGMTETFTTNVAQDSATAGLTRTFRWESSTTGSNGTFSLIKQGTGATNASFAWVPTDTSTSGSNFVYRVVVTDSDTAGLFIVETSTAVFAVINRTLVLSSKATLTKTVNIAKTETFTVSNGTPTYRYSLTPTSPNFWLDTSTAGSPRIKFADTVTVGTYYETFTVIDSVSATIIQPLTIVVSPPPSFSANTTQVDSGSVLYLDAGNRASYPGTGSTWNDISGRGLVASFPPVSMPAQNGVTSFTCTTPSYSSSNLGNLVFNGTDTCGYLPNLGIQKIYTYEVWVKRSGNTMGDYSAIIASPWAGSPNQIAITLHWRNQNQLQAGLWNGGAWAETALTTIADQTWTHIAVTFSGTSLSMTLNGQTGSKSTVAVSISWNDANNNTGLLIGKRFDGTASFFSGSLGSIRMYDRVLSDAEIQQNYNATKGRFLLTQNKQSVTGKYGTTVNETYTVTAGSESITASFTASAVAALVWDTSTARSVRVQLQDSLTAGTYTDTLTVTDVYGASTRIPLTFVIAKADTLTISMDTGTVTIYSGAPITTYPKPVFRGLVGSDTVTVTTKFSSSTYSLSAIAPTNADTYTVSANNPIFAIGNSINYTNIIYETSTAVINRSRQIPLNISLYGAVVGAPFTITLLGGSGDGAVTESLTGTSTMTGCAIASHVLSATSTDQGYCTLSVVKAQSQNYLMESATVQVYFMKYIINTVTNAVGSGSAMALNGVTPIYRDSAQAPTVTTLSAQSGAIGSTLTIGGSGFYFADASQLSVKFWRNVSALSSSYTSYTDSSVTVLIPAGATTGRILISTPHGSFASEVFTVSP